MSGISLAQAIQVFVVMGKDCARHAMGAGNLDHVNTIEVVVMPMGYLGGVATKGAYQIFHKLFQVGVFPRDENGGVAILGLFHFRLESLDVRIGIRKLDWHSAVDGRGLNGREGTNVVGFVLVIILESGHGCENKLRRPEFGKKHLGQRQRTIETLAIELTEAIGLLFPVAEADEGLDILTVAG